MTARAEADRVSRLLKWTQGSLQGQVVLREMMGLGAIAARQLGDTEIALAQMAIAVTLTLEEDEDLRPDSALLTTEMALCYRQFAMADRAADLLREYIARVPPLEQSASSWCLYLATLLDHWDFLKQVDDHSGADCVLAEISRALERDDVAFNREGYRDARLITRLRIDTQLCDPAAISAATRRLILGLPEQSDSWAYHGALLTAKNNRDIALDLLSRASQQMRRRGDDPWRLSRLDQQRAALILEKDPSQALEIALGVWIVMDELRYSVGSARIRASVFESYGVARRVAMDSACALRDWRLLLELMENTRLQCAPEMQGDRSETLAILHEFDSRAASKDPMPTSTVENNQGKLVPPPYCYPFEDCLGEQSMTMRAPIDISVDEISTLSSMRARLGPQLTFTPVARDRVDSSHPLAVALGDGPWVWYATWVESGRVYWVLSQEAGRNGGCIRIQRNGPLGSALRACAKSVPSASGTGEQSVKDLLVHGSAAELSLTRALGQLVPSALASPAAPPRLALSVAPELACVPWPILPLRGPDDRVLDRFDLHYLPSLAVLIDPVSSPPQGPGTPLPFLLSVDYFPEDETIAAPAEATTVLGTRRQAATFPAVTEATGLNLVKWMVDVRPGQWGLAAFRAHYSSVSDFPEADLSMHPMLREDPNRSGLLLADGSLPAAMLAATDRITNKPLLGLTTHVILGCCSSTGARERTGGEALGLTAGCIRSGAKCVIATSVDIAACQFTDRALRSLAQELISSPYDPFMAFNDFSRSMLREWRMASDAGRMSWAGQLTSTAIPFVWAYFQAYGISTNSWNR